MASRWARPTSSLSFADEGNVMANSIASLSFEYRFKLHLIVTDDGATPAPSWWPWPLEKVHQCNLVKNFQGTKIWIRRKVLKNYIKIFSQKI